MEILKVSTRSNPSSVAGAIAGAIRQAGVVEAQVVGAGALNQAIKAMAIARGYVAPSGIELVCIPVFVDVDINGERRTAIRLCIEDRRGQTTAVQLHGEQPVSTKTAVEQVGVVTAEPPSPRAPAVR